MMDVDTVYFDDIRHTFSLEVAAVKSDIRWMGERA